MDLEDDITEKEDAIKLTKAESEAMRKERERDGMQGIPPGNAGRADEKFYR